MENSNINKLTSIVDKQRRFFNTNRTKDLNFRISMLHRLRSSVEKYEEQILDALFKDLGKGRAESYLSEVGFILLEISHTIKYLKHWVRDEKVKTNVLNFGSSSYIII